MKILPRALIVAAAGVAIAIGTGAAAQNRPAPVRDPGAMRDTMPARSGGQMRADTNNDGTISRTEAMAAAEMRFTRADANRDGRLTPEDRTLRTAQAGGEAFTRMDTDGNGAISRREFDQARAARVARRGERRIARGAVDGPVSARGAGRRASAGGRQSLQRLADSNNDGAIDRAEFMAIAAQRFARGDADNDGNLTAAERAAQRTARRDRRGQRPAG